LDDLPDLSLIQAVLAWLELIIHQLEAEND
jgi:hypothetical protein